MFRKQPPRRPPLMTVLILAMATLTVGAGPMRAEQPPAPPLPAPESDWTIQITPRQTAADDGARRSYEGLYTSIPFRRSEYLANPAYRHEAVMELHFGAMRPTVVHRTDVPQRVINPRPMLEQPYRMSTPEYWQLLRNARPSLGYFDRFFAPSPLSVP